MHLSDWYTQNLCEYRSTGEMLMKETREKTVLCKSLNHGQDSAQQGSLLKIAFCSEPEYCASAQFCYALYHSPHPAGRTRHIKSSARSLVLSNNCALLTQHDPSRHESKFIDAPRIPGPGLPYHESGPQDLYYDRKYSRTDAILVPGTLSHVPG
jgi:hypothetical protein